MKLKKIKDEMEKVEDSEIKVKMMNWKWYMN